MEIENAVNQAQKELATRFDFKGSNAEIVLEKTEIKLRANDSFRMQQLSELVQAKLNKRNISPKQYEVKDAELSPLGHARQSILLKAGIDGVNAKAISLFIRQSGIKVTASIQGDELRVSGKNRDDLQAAIAALRQEDFPVALSFVNFRD